MRRKVSETATPIVLVPRSRPISARPGGRAAAKAAAVVEDGHGATPASRAAASIAASPAGSSAKVVRASAAIAAASSPRPSTPSERISRAQSAGGPPASASRCPRLRDHALDHRLPLLGAHRRGGVEVRRTRSRRRGVGEAGLGRGLGEAGAGRLDPGRVGRAVGDQRGEDGMGEVGAAALHQGDARVVAPDRVARVELEGADEGGLGLGADVAAGGHDAELGEVDVGPAPRPRSRAAPTSSACAARASGQRPVAARLRASRRRPSTSSGRSARTLAQPLDQRLVLGGRRRRQPARDQRLGSRLVGAGGRRARSGRPGEPSST